MKILVINGPNINFHWNKRKRNILAMIIMTRLLI